MTSLMAELEKTLTQVMVETHPSQVASLFHGYPTFCNVNMAAHVIVVSLERTLYSTNVFLLYVVMPTSVSEAVLNNFNNI